MLTFCRAMQDCFRAHPDVYGAELEEEDDEAEGDPAGPDAAPSGQKPSAVELDASSHPDEKRDAAEKSEHPDALVPKASHDAEEKNQQPEK